MYRILIALSAVAALSGFAFTHMDHAQAASSAKAQFSPYVDASGNISRPTDFRDNWVHLGTWFVKKDKNAAGPGVHDVYAQPSAVKAFKKNGEWPDGAVLVKEIRSIKSEQLTTGLARYSGDKGVWFVMVRDRHHRFPDNPIWGKGWGWALFKADQPAKNVNTDWKKGTLSNCFSCHVPAKATNWVYLKGYPTIRKAAIKKYGKAADPDAGKKSSM